MTDAIADKPRSMPPPRRLVLRTIRLTKLLDGRRVLDGVDLEIAEGERIGLTGDNGAGKTTLLRCLAGELRPTSGQVEWCRRAPGSRVSLKQHVGLVAHQSRVYADLTARENLMFAARMCRVSAPADRVGQWLHATGLAGHAQRPASQFSCGMQQRLAVARALIHDPQMVLLDEPFAGMDHEGSRWLERLIRDLSLQNRTVVFTTHDTQQTAALATRVVKLNGGRLHERNGDVLVSNSLPTDPASVGAMTES